MDELPAAVESVRRPVGASSTALRLESGRHTEMFIVYRPVFNRPTCERLISRISSTGELLRRCRRRHPCAVIHTPMTPKFAHAVDDIFVYVIDLLSRIERNEQPNHKDERSKVRELLERAEVRVDSREEWKLAKYALVAWIDEALTQAEWNARKGWREKTLENGYFKTDNAAIQFFLNARESRKNLSTKTTAAEVCITFCVMVGFRGIYSGPGGGDTADHHGLDANLDTWIERTAAAIRVKPERPPITAKTQSIDVAAALRKPGFSSWECRC